MSHMLLAVLRLQNPPELAPIAINSVRDSSQKPSCHMPRFSEPIEKEGSALTSACLHERSQQLEAQAMNIGTGAGIDAGRPTAKSYSQMTSFWWVPVSSPMMSLL